MAPPINDDFADAIVVLDGILEEVVSGTTVDATSEADWETLGGYAPEPVVWYRFETPGFETKLWINTVKTGGDAAFFPGIDMHTGPSNPADYDDLSYEFTVGDGTATPSFEWRVVPANTHFYALVYNYDFDGVSEGDFDIEFQLVPSGFREEWEELDPAIWEIGNAGDPTSGHWSISSAEAFSGTTSVKFDNAGGGAKSLIYQDEVDGNQNGVEYWLAYKFLVEDWDPIFNDTGDLQLPGFLTGPNSTAGTDLNITLEALSSTTGELILNTDGTNDSFPITAGQWYELRLMMERTGSNVTIHEFFEGTQVSTSYAWGTIGANPSGVRWRQDDVEGVLYVDPLIYQVGSDPGPISPIGGDDEIVVPFIDETTTVFTPILDGAIDLEPPFIASTTTVFDAYLSGDQDVPAPFISPTTTVFTPALLADNTARISQEPVEVVLTPTDAEARISQEPVEVVLAPTDADARISQVPVEVLLRNLRESVIVIVID